MRKRDRLGCWQQILTLSGTSLLSEREWVKVNRDFVRSWNRNYYINLEDNKLPDANGNPKVKNYDVTAPSADVVSAPGRQRYTMVPLPGLAVSHIKRCNSVASPSAPSVLGTKRHNSLATPTAPSVLSIKRRNSLAPPSAPPIDSIKRRNSLAPPFAAPIHPSKGQICDTLLKTEERKNSVADADQTTDMLLNPIKRSDSVIPECEMMYEFNGPIKRRDSIALDQWLRPIQSISPLAPSPISHRDSLSSDLGINRKESVSPLSPFPIKRRHSSVTAPQARLKSKSSLRKPLQKPISVVKHVTGSGDELDDEMSLSAWKEYSAHRKAMNTKALVSPPENTIPPQRSPKIVQVEPPVKRKRGRPSREEKARRLEEEQALKIQQALASAKDPEPSMNKLKTKHEPNQKTCKIEEAEEPLDARKKQQKTASQSLKPSEPPKQKPTVKPTAKPRCQTTSSFSEQEGSDNAAIHSNNLILKEDAIPSAHKPADALDLKSPRKIPSSGDKEEGERADTEGKGKEEEDKVRPKTNSVANGYNNKGRSTYDRILGSLSSEEEEDEQLLLQQTGFILNDFDAEEQLIDQVMDLTSPVGGIEGDKDVEKQLLDNVMDLTCPVGGENGYKDDLIIDLDLLVRDDIVENQIALIDPQLEINFNQCQEEAMDNNSKKNDPSLEALNSTNDHQLTHSTEFFEKLSSQPPVDVKADKSNLLWPFMDEDEVLDYEVDYDVLTLVVSSDELEDECQSKSKKEAKKNPEAESQNKSQVESSKTDLPPKSEDKPGIPNENGLKGFRIPKLNPELLKAQPTVMQSVYLQEEEGEKQNREKIKPVESKDSPEELRKRRKEAIANRRPKETSPQFAPPYRRTREEQQPVPEDLSQPLFGPQNLPQPLLGPQNLSQPLLGPQNVSPPLFGPDDLAPIFVPPSNSNREMPNYPHPREASQFVPPDHFLVSNCSSLGNRNFLPEVQQPQHFSGVSQYIPQNLATNQRNMRPAEVSPPGYQGLGARNWIMEIFGAKCLRYLDNKCLAPNCDHTMSPVGAVEMRLLNMPEETLVHTYRQALRSFHIFKNFFKCFANIFERRKLDKHLLQMMINSRLYRNMTVAIIMHVFPALKRCGLEVEATGCIMTHLWMPDKAHHQFRELTLAILQILEATNWPDYIDQLVELHEKYKFLVSDEFMISIMRWADATKNAAHQKKAMIMLLAGMKAYAGSPTLMSLIGKFSNPEPNSNLPQGSPAQQQYLASNWNQNAETNQIPSLITPRKERLPGAGPGPSPLRSNSVLKPHWTHNPNPNPNPNPFPDLPGASLAPSLIWSCPPAGEQYQEQQQPQQQHLASTWRSQAEANDHTYSSYPAGFQ